MSTDAIFSALGGGGLATIALALIAWMRSKDKDQADVAKQWESGVSTVLRSAETQVIRLEATVERVTAKAEALEAEVDDLNRRLALSRNLSRDMAADLDHRGADTAEYRTRLRAI